MEGEEWEEQEGGGEGEGGVVLSAETMRGERGTCCDDTHFVI